MESSSFKRFKSLPLPFADSTDTPAISPSGPSCPNNILPLKSPGSFLTMTSGSPVVTSALLDLDESSVDSGLGLDAAFETLDGSVPKSFEGLIESLVLSSASRDFVPEFVSGSRDLRHSNKPRDSSRRRLFGCDVTPFHNSGFHRKRSALSGEKRRRNAVGDDSDDIQLNPKKTRVVPPPGSDVIKCALDQEEDSRNDVIGDFSKPHCLPRIPGKHSDLQCVAPETISDLLIGKFSDVVDKFAVIDCRYPYEFDGGHIENALNVWNRDLLTQHLLDCDDLKPTPGCHKRNIIVFHCEFSSERAPKMLRFLRQLDRDAHKECYPALDYPELYLLEGGYKAFYQHHPNLCSPQAYKPMVHDDHLTDLKYFRTKSKSWNGEKSVKRTHRRQLKL